LLFLDTNRSEEMTDNGGQQLFAAGGVFSAGLVDGTV
jgi:hypothetical protein